MNSWTRQQRPAKLGTRNRADSAGCLQGQFMKALGCWSAGFLAGFGHAFKPTRMSALRAARAFGECIHELVMGCLVQTTWALDMCQVEE